MIRVPPSYIVQSGILDLPLEFPWKGEGMHFGASQGTKLHAALGQMTTCAQVTVTALLEEWLVWRFQKAVDVSRFLHHVDSVLAWTIDRRYRDDSSLKGSIPNDTPVNQALGDGVWGVRLAAADSLWDFPNLTEDKTAALVSIIKQTLPDKPKKAFSAWVQRTVETAAKLAPWPSKHWPERNEFESQAAYREAAAPFFGQAIPREALEPDSGYKPEQRQEALGRFLASLDWNANPFLRSPEAMKALGFEGTPYKL